MSTGRVVKAGQRSKLRGLFKPNSFKQINFIPNLQVSVLFVHLKGWLHLKTMLQRGPRIQKSNFCVSCLMLVSRKLSLRTCQRSIL